MKDKTIEKLTKKEYEIVCFYRKLPKKKKEKFEQLLESLRKILIEESIDSLKFEQKELG